MRNYNEATSQPLLLPSDNQPEFSPEQAYQAAVDGADAFLERLALTDVKLNERERSALWSDYNSQLEAVGIDPIDTTVLFPLVDEAARQPVNVSYTETVIPDQANLRPSPRHARENQLTLKNMSGKAAHAALWLTGLREGRNSRRPNSRYLRMVSSVAALALVGLAGANKFQAHYDPEADMCPPTPTATASFDVQSEHVQDGVEVYDYTSKDDGCGVHTLRVLKPTNPKQGVPHKFIIMLPVEANENHRYGDPLEVVQKLNAQNLDNATFIEPSFPIEPWYTNNPKNPNLRIDTFMADDLAPWIDENLSTTGKEDKYLIGFSKSGTGALDLIFRHPRIFNKAGVWDFPLVNKASQFGYNSSDSYGPDGYFQTHDRITPEFLRKYGGPFKSEIRIALEGCAALCGDVREVSRMFDAAGIEHITGQFQHEKHKWGKIWVGRTLHDLGAGDRQVELANANK